MSSWMMFILGLRAIRFVKNGIGRPIQLVDAGIRTSPSVS